MNIAVMTSGGDAPGMNAAIRAVVRTSIYKGMEVYGIYGGFEGLIDGKIEKLNLSSVADIIQKGGTILGTSRSKRFQTEEGQESAVSKLKIYNIDKLVVLGGDGSAKGALALEKKGIKTAVIPCTIDNDMGYTESTIGFYTAVETVTDAISKIRDTTEAHGRANVVEVMGRSCGDIALYAGISGGAESIIVPEMETNMDEIAKKMLEGKNRGKRHHIILVAEGAGEAHEVARELQKLTGIETRVTILGYIQRGGSPGPADRIMATSMGVVAVESLLENKSAAIGIRGGRIFSEPIGTALRTKNKFNRKLYETMKMVSI
ncbi:6-phosphofructokinase [Peptoniphilus duerdenii ATCC BAA-1640]|uniref:ATP-dependent 6-phosphofructokinase n=1 Tax=Peptoniphilus duerdenii ATCC BAA-1640 TaxID=862517 RepID=E0NJ47_9FIRM|nr:6-phosphofructokinase [Peptoniphilus duerdenii]EFM26166.1 6-phosphofructokinase [Peptoniphilus duerdenii ATCC BAA-1640]